MLKGRSLLGAAGIGLGKLKEDSTSIVEAISPLPQVHSTQATHPTDELPALRQRGPRSRNASPRIASGEVRMQTVYVTPDDQDRAMDVIVRLKKTRALRGQIGFSLAVRIGLRLLEKRMGEDAHCVLDIARELTSS